MCFICLLYQPRTASAIFSPARWPKVRKDYYEMKKRIEGVSNTLLSITQAQEQYGVVTDPKAQNIVALYGALMTMNEKKGVPAAESAASIGYIMYAYLGGQAKRDVSYNPIEE